MMNLECLIWGFVFLVMGIELSFLVFEFVFFFCFIKAKNVIFS
jgi:hypothetical protein